MSKFHYLNIGLLVIAVIVLYPYFYDTKLFMGGDNAAYYILGDALANGEGYVMYNDPDLPAANHFPPGYPFLLSVFLFLFKGSITFTDQLNGLFLALTMMMTYLLIFRLTGQRTFAAITAFFLLLNRHIFEFSTFTMSEIPFTFFLLLSLYLILVVSDKGKSYRNPVFYIMLAVIILTIYIRTQGLILVGAATLFFVFRKQYIQGVLVAAVSVLALIPWQVRSHHLGGNSYVKQLLTVNPYDAASGPMTLKDWPVRISKNAVRYVSKELPNGLFPAVAVEYNNPKGKIIPAPAKNWFIGITIIVLALLGVWSLKAHRWLLVTLLLGSAFVLLLWPEVWFGIRFLLPLVPLLTFCVFLGIWWILQKIFRKLPEAVFPKRWAFALLPLFLLHITPLKALHVKTQSQFAPNWKNYFKTAEWASERLPENAIVVTRKPELFYVMSHRKSISFPSTKDEELFLNYLLDKKVTHVILEQLGFRQTGLYLAPFILNNPDKFRIEYSYGIIDKDTRAGVWVYHFDNTKGYHGPYKNGKKEGKGYILLANGTRIDGHWSDNKLNGPGVMITADSMRYEGSWKNGVKTGEFYITDKRLEQRVLSVWVNDTMQQYGWYVDAENRKLREIKLYEKKP